MKLSLAVSFSAFLAGVWAFQHFDLDNAQRFVRYAHAAMCPENQVMEWSCRYCFNYTEGFQPLFFSFNDSTDNAFYIGVNPLYKEIVVSFRGTNPSVFSNWIQDFSIVERRWPYGEQEPKAVLSDDDVWIHRGFAEVYSSHRELLHQKLPPVLNEYPDYQLRLVGHSMGGAQAYLAAVDLNAVYNISNIEITTFGSPRVGNSHFAKVFSKVFAENSLRFTHNKDIVVHIPLRSLHYEHVPKEVFEDEKGEFHLCDETGEDPNCSNRYNVFRALSIGDHTKYLGLQATACENPTTPSPTSEDPDDDDWFDDDEDDDWFLDELEDNLRIM